MSANETIRRRGLTVWLNLSYSKEYGSQQYLVQKSISLFNYSQPQQSDSNQNLPKSLQIPPKTQKFTTIIHSHNNCRHGGLGFFFGIFYYHKKLDGDAQSGTPSRGRPVGDAQSGTPSRGRPVGDAQSKKYPDFRQSVRTGKGDQYGGNLFA
jgi:hypothetical protein